MQALYSMELRKYTVILIILICHCISRLCQGFPYANITECYVCKEQNYYDCITTEYIQQCPATYNSCQSRVIVMDKGRKKYERKCAVMSFCETVKNDLLANGFCHGNSGSMCVGCCQGDLCNNDEPTHNGVMNTDHPTAHIIFGLAIILCMESQDI